jgi:hypothetical protein
VLLPVLSGIFWSCENEPNDFGLNYISPDDTLKKYVLDSRIDTVLITAANPKQYINTAASSRLYVGKYQNYESRGMMKFKDIPSGYDTNTTVISATLNFRYGKSYFQDSLGTTSFNIYKLKRSFDFATVTFDSVMSGDIGTVSVADYTGTLSDTSLVTIPFSTQTVAGILKYGGDTGYILLPNLTSTNIKGLYSSNTDYKPYILAVVTKNKSTDTLKIYTTTTSLNDAPLSVLLSDRIVIQAGVSYWGNLKFDLSKLPGKVIINEAYLELKLDNANSFITTSSDKKIAAAMLTDSIKQITNGAFFYSSNDSLTYSFRLNAIFQSWNYGTFTNYGLQLIPREDVLNLDKFVFYSPSVSDVNKKPYLRIIYTIRNQ